MKSMQRDTRLWNLYTKAEEYNPQHLDDHDRFLFQYSEHRSVFEPKISEFLMQQGLSIEYPAGYEFAICLTHDVDTLFLSKKRSLYEAARHIIMAGGKRLRPYLVLKSCEIVGGNKVAVIPLGIGGPRVGGVHPIHLLPGAIGHHRQVH